jgi:hypothetical protein
VKILRSDGGGEYGSKEFKSYLESKGIKHEKTNAYTPQENGVAERMNWTLVESAHSMLNDANLPNSFWEDAVEYAGQIRNIVPTRALPDITPHESFTGNKPDVSHFRTFGCKAYVHIPDEKRRKLDPKTIPCTFIGYAKDKKAYRCIDRRTKVVYESRDVVFDESGSKGAGLECAKVEIDPVNNLPLSMQVDESENESDGEEVDSADQNEQPATHPENSDPATAPDI